MIRPPRAAIAFPLHMQSLAYRKWKWKHPRCPSSSSTVSIWTRPFSYFGNSSSTDPPSRVHLSIRQSLLQCLFLQPQRIDQLRLQYSLHLSIPTHLANGIESASVNRTSVRNVPQMNKFLLIDFLFSLLNCL